MGNRAIELSKPGRRTQELVREASGLRGRRAALMCPVCESPLRAEIEAELAAGGRFERVVLRLPPELLVGVEILRRHWKRHTSRELFVQRGLRRLDAVEARLDKLQQQRLAQQDQAVRQGLRKLADGLRQSHVETATEAVQRVAHDLSDTP